MTQASSADMPKTEETVLYEAHPAMFRAAPISFVLSCLLVLVGIGAVILLVWWINTKRTTLTVTDSRTRLRKGLLSVHITEVWHSHVRNVELRQTAYERIFGVGSIGIASAGKASYEIEIAGLPEIHKIKELIDQHRIAQTDD